MKQPARRLGRGLGAFLDFDPAGDDGEAFIEDAIGGEKASVLQTSTTSAAAPVRTAPAPARAAAPTPAAAAPSPAPRVTVPPPPPAEEPAFFDDEIVSDISFDDDVPVASAPAPAPAPRVVAPEPPRAAAPPPPARPAPEPVSESGFLDDEVITGIAFPEVDLE